ncbi:MAG: hypothetical protein HC838_13680, partial [Spirulinaceae cyanobacterium RM2_2_10]|nr:hypothetical protein [Spirulinaceae cyanobacterium RM2_2_10]
MGLQGCVEVSDTTIARLAVGQRRRLLQYFTKASRQFQNFFILVPMPDSAVSVASRDSSPAAPLASETTIELQPEQIRSVLDADTLSASEIGHYDPNLINAYYRRHPLQVLARIGDI